MPRISHPIGSTVSITPECRKLLGYLSTKVDIGPESLITGVDFSVDGDLAYGLDGHDVVFRDHDFRVVAAPTEASVAAAFKLVCTRVCQRSMSTVSADLLGDQDV